MELKSNNSFYLSFQSCTSLTTIPDYFFNTTSITNFSNCFSSCTSLYDPIYELRKSRREKLKIIFDKYGS